MSVQYLNSLSSKLRSTMPNEAGGSPTSPMTAGGTAVPAASSVGASGLKQSKSTKFGVSDSASRSKGTMESLYAKEDAEVMRARMEELLQENDTLKKERDRRTESYLRRETNYQAEIEDLKGALSQQNKAKPKEFEAMKGLRDDHQKVMDRLRSMQSREQASLHDQEKDLLRAFRARLWDVQFELETERSKKDDGALEWIEKTKTLGKELDWSRDEALRLDRVNQFLQKENARLKTQLRAQEDDREFILKQMLSLKKENAALKAQAGGMGGEPGEPSSPMSVALSSVGRPSSGSITRPFASAGSINSNRPRTATAAGGRGLESFGDANGEASLATGERIKELMLQQAESEERYKEVVARLKRLLDVERRNLKAVRAAHAKDTQGRTELELLLRACVDDVRKEVAAQRGASEGTASKAGGGAGASTVAMDSLGPKDRERVLELLLSQERVVSLLYEKTFTMESKALADASLDGGEAPPSS